MKSFSKSEISSTYSTTGRRVWNFTSKLITEKDFRFRPYTMFYSILPMNTKFFTNDSDNALLNKFEGVFKYSNVHCFDALVGSFRSSGYLRIRPFLDKVPKVRIPLGIYVDKLV